jgi:glutamate dehydrogenase
MSAVVYLPRDRYTTNVRLRIEQELRETFHAESIDYEARMTESALARLFFRIRLPKRNADVSHVNTELEQAARPGARSWSEGISPRFSASGRRQLDGANELAAIWAEAFPAGYRVDYESKMRSRTSPASKSTGREAERAGRKPARIKPGVHVYLPEGAGATLEEDARVKLYMLEPKSLSQILPYFHNLGLEVLDERPFEIETADTGTSSCTTSDSSTPRAWTPCHGQLLGDSFGAAVTGAVESDSFDRLVLREGMHVASGCRAARLRQVHAANGKHQLV